VTGGTAVRVAGPPALTANSPYEKTAVFSSSALLLRDRFSLLYRERPEGAGGPTTDSERTK